MVCRVRLCVLQRSAKNMLLLEYDYHPGWTMGDYTSWNTKVTIDGVLTQHIDPELGKSKRKNGAIIHKRELTVEEYSSLEKMLREFPKDFSKQLEDIGVCIDDAENVYLNAPEFDIKFSGPIHCLNHMQKKNEFNSDIDITPAMNLWKKIDEMQEVKAI